VQAGAQEQIAQRIPRPDSPAGPVAIPRRILSTTVTGPARQSTRVARTHFPGPADPARRGRAACRGRNRRSWREMMARTTWRVAAGALPIEEDGLGIPRLIPPAVRGAADPRRICLVRRAIRLIRCAAAGYTR
jgi:hypothetical protein